MISPESTLLLVEDDEDDVFFMQRALGKAKIVLPMKVVVDGRQALDYLGGLGVHADRTAYPIPAIIFLDLKLPYVDGFEVLQWTRQQPSLKEITVLILTSSPEERDRQKAMDLGAKDYLVKPPTVEMLVSAMRFLQQPSAPLSPLNVPKVPPTQRSGYSPETPL